MAGGQYRMCPELVWNGVTHITLVMESAGLHPPLLWVRRQRFFVTYQPSVAIFSKIALCAF